MKQLGILIVFDFCCKIIFAQPAVNFGEQTRPPGTGNTYAIVIGISYYKYPEIPKLNFSNRDAVVFADFLMSASGGSVPKQNIRLLTDSMASTGEVDKALRWVLYTCQPNDLVYFYFSGHGEMENVTMNKNGYLICYNTPAVAITNMGLSIAYLNDVLNTLSVQTKAKVIAITDACHSGTMNGNKFRGNFFVGEQLMLKKENEIRMASSQPDQLSNENVDWGGGRGIFSYYLVNGLQGDEADANHDGKVSVGELKNYLESKMANDPILKNEEHIQTPVIDYNSDFQLATVVEVEAKKIKEQVKSDSISTMMIMSSMSQLNEDENTEPDAYFLNLLKTQSLEGLTDSLKLNLLTTDEIVFALIEGLINQQKKQTLERLNNSINTSVYDTSVLNVAFKTSPEKDFLTETGKRKLTELEAALKTDKEQLNRFNLDLASAFLDIGQAVIANYIQGDEAELERRRYYNSNNNGYDVYTRIFTVALKLSQTNTYYSNKAAVFLHYFSGLALRLKIPLTENPGPLIEQALDEQKKALDLEEHAAYIYNELGILYQYQKNFAEAEKNFIKATQLSPQWAIPQSNLSGLYTAQHDYNKAIDFIEIADSLQKNLQSISINRGFINERKGNLLFAEEDYHHAIEINNRHFVPFERLGYVNMNTTNYAMADSFFYEADLRKKGYHFKGNEWERIVEPLHWVDEPLFPCDIDTTKLNPTDVFAFFTWGVQEYWAKNYNNAIRILKKVIALDNRNPLVYHYLGKIYYDQQKWEEADIMFNLAIPYSKNKNEFKKYFDSVRLSTSYKYYHSCFENFFSGRYYNQIEDYFFAGTVYEKWGHLQEAETCFKKIIKLEPNETGGYIKLWQLTERQGRLIETEEVIKKYGRIDNELSDRELNVFYRRSIEKYPEDGNLIYRFGTFLYNRCLLNKISIPDYYTHYIDNQSIYIDTIVRFPLLNEELWIDADNYSRLLYNDSFRLSDQSETGAKTEISILTLKGVLQYFEAEEKNYIVPGTMDTIALAYPIFMPRKDGIAYLKRAAELIAEKEAQADINFKIGNIYLIAGSKKQAYPYLEKSSAFEPGNANTRLQLIDIYTALYKNRAALKQLDYLYDSSQINFEKRMLLAKFNMYAGNFAKANELLNKAEFIYPCILPMIDNLRGLSYMLADKPTDAIDAYKKSINAQKKDPWFNDYSLARLNAKTGNVNDAWKYLQSAINFGFNYSYVLQNDSYMESLRNTTKWQTVINGIAMKKYKLNKPVN
jgi:Flp pilus assembly protein TadD